MSFHHQLNLPHFTQRSVLFNSMSRTSSRMRSPTSKNYFYFARCPSEFGHYPVLRRMAGTRYFWHEMGYNTRLRLRRISLVFNPISQEKYDGDGYSFCRRFKWAQSFYDFYVPQMGGGILHTKLWLVDREHFYVGSANFDWRSLTQVRSQG